MQDPQCHQEHGWKSTEKGARVGVETVVRREILGCASESQGQDSFLYYQEEKGTLLNNFPGNHPWFGRTGAQATSQRAHVEFKSLRDKALSPVIF